MLTYTVFQSFTILNEAQSFHPIYLACEIIAKDNSVKLHSRENNDIIAYCMKESGF